MSVRDKWKLAILNMDISVCFRCPFCGGGVTRVTRIGDEVIRTMQHSVACPYRMVQEESSKKHEHR